MKQFALTEWTSATIESATPRIERHGTEKVVAISLGLRINAPNLMIDLHSETLRDGLYSEDETQDDIPGVTRVTTNLRAPEFAGMKFELPTLLEGATVYFDHGVDGENDPIVLGEAKVDKVKVSPLPSAWCDYFLRVGSNDISDEELGILCGKLGHETRIRIEPPQERVETDLVIDGSRGPLFDGPDDESDGEGDTPDATDAFVDAHGED
jgi:hypothetical protein